MEEMNEKELAIAKLINKMIIHVEGKEDFHDSCVTAGLFTKRMSEIRSYSLDGVSKADNYILIDGIRRRCTFYYGNIQTRTKCYSFRYKLIDVNEKRMIKLINIYS